MKFHSLHVAQKTSKLCKIHQNVSGHQTRISGHQREKQVLRQIYDQINMQICDVEREGNDGSVKECLAV